MQAAVGSAFIGGGLQLHGDYLLHPYLLHARESYVLPVYVEVGARLIDWQKRPRGELVRRCSESAVPERHTAAASYRRTSWR